MMQIFKLCISFVAVLVLTSAIQAAPLGTNFTYQGKLAQNGLAVTEICDFSFELWDALLDGNQVSLAQDVPAVLVTDGTFTVELDFGDGAFDGNVRWLEIAVACPDGGSLTTLAPRQELTPSPYALFAGMDGGAGWQLNGSRIYYNEGNVGIGSTSPNFSLEIRDSDAAIALINEDQTTTGLLMADAQAFFSENASVLFDAGNPSLLFSLNGTERMRIAPAGVGVGTTAPAVDLHIRGASPLGRLLVTPGTADSSAQLMLTENTSASLGGILRYDGTSNQLQLLGQNSGDVGPHLVVGRENGRVGIGVTTPGALLDVQGAGTTAGGNAGFNEVVTRFLRPSGGHSAVAIDAPANQDAILYFSENGAAVWSVRSDHITDFANPQLNIRFQHEGSNTTALRFTGHSSGADVHPGLDDNVLLGSLLGGAWKSITTYNLSNLSDARRKQDVRDLDYGLEEINRLRPVRFKWVNRPEDGEYFGVIAQDVQQVLPEIVRSEANDPQQTLGVDYLALVPVLIRGIQQQQASIQSLEYRNQELEVRLAALESMIRKGSVVAETW